MKGSSWLLVVGRLLTSVSGIRQVGTLSKVNNDMHGITNKIPNPSVKTKVNRSGLWQELGDLF